MLHRWVLALFCTLAVLGQPAGTNLPPAQITEIRSALELSSANAESKIPAKIQGIVTCSDARANLSFVQDETAGIYVWGMNPLPPFGARVEVTGSTGKGLFSPIILAAKVDFGPTNTLPAALPVALEELSSGRYDAQWVEVEGVILRVFEDWGHTVLTLGSGRGRLDVRILQSSSTNLPNWVDARVRVKGVAAATYNYRGQLTGFHLLSQNTNLVTMLKEPPADPYAMDLRLSSELMTYSRQGAAEHRMRLRGTVLFYWPGRDFYIRDEAGGFRVQSRQQTKLQPGDVIEVIGFPIVGQHRPMVTEATFRKIGSGNEPAAKFIQPRGPLDSELDGELVTLEATVLQNVEAHRSYHAIVVQTEDKTVRAFFHKDWALGQDQYLVGGKVRVTGVCDLGVGPGAAEQFSIWMRKPEDFQITSRPPAWRQRQMAFILGGLGGAVALGGISVLLLRMRVRQQTDVIRKREAALEGRFKDLFENANDIIYTHDLEGRITSSNNSGQVLLGYTAEEILRMNISQLIDPADAAIAKEQLRLKKEGATRTTYEIHVRNRQGQRLCLEINSRLIYKDGVPVGVQGFARDITARKNAEDALRVSERHLRASLQERERLGRDLHDGLIQSIYAAGLNIDDCAHLAKTDADGVERRLRKVAGDLNRVIRDVRNFITGLERHKLKGEEFKAALKSLTLSAGESQAARVEIMVDETAAAELNPVQATQLLHIAREALSNSLRHANAQKVTLDLRRDQKRLVFEVADDGVGFNPTATHPRSFGLRNMAARAAEINAEFQIVTQSGEGTRIVLDIGQPTPEKSISENPVAHR